MYKQSAAVMALFLGSSQAINLGKHHHHHHEPQYVGVRFLDAGKFADGYAVGESMGGNITMNGPTAQETYKYAQQQKQWAEGYTVGESMGNNITINGPKGQEGYNYAQQGRQWAEGYAVGESMGNNVTMNGPTAQENYKYAQQNSAAGVRFAEGYGDKENFGDSIRTTGPEKFLTTSFVQVEDPVAWQGAGVAFPPVPPTPGFVGTAAGTASNVNLKGSDGKASIIDAQESEKFGDDATEKAQTRLPYASTLIQTADPVSWQGAGVAFPPVPPTPGFVGTAAATASNTDKKGSDGKASIIDAQESEQFGDDATEKAQTRLPYASTLVQLEDPVAWQGAGVPFPPVPPTPGFVATAAATASNTDKKGSDGKASIIDAQESEQFGDDATDKAQTRLPYASTLLQMRDDEIETMVKEEKEVPLNFHFVHIGTDDGELIRIE